MEMVDNRQALMKMLVKELGFTEKQVRHVIQLTEEGNTVPFIARYRKEWTGSLDEVQIRAILERWQYMMRLEDRKEEVLRLIGEKGKLTEELRRHIVAATKLQEVEDLYRPYKEKRRTKATIAKEKGLEPLAEWLLLYKKKIRLKRLWNLLMQKKKWNLQKRRCKVRKTLLQKSFQMKSRIVVGFGMLLLEKVLCLRL